MCEAACCVSFSPSKGNKEICRKANAFVIINRVVVLLLLRSWFEDVIYEKSVIRH